MECQARTRGGVNFPSPGQPGMPQPRAELDRFFAACAALEITLAMHIG